MIKVLTEKDGSLTIKVGKAHVLQLRDEMISQPGLTTKPASQRTPLEQLAISVTEHADAIQKQMLRKVTADQERWRKMLECGQ